ncbi:SusC/RagA family TonB-linked outer membrane protein [Sphingobacterium psychroaquaticum]|uniref:SusC/RagA family TonB-linked outer membrane protein n=1 Tax=Sphingobacterium psychroaquaticum TaxID=561061 RepID=UPI00106D6941|nr:SusC/RagA family TonB-linked outer membrane protein [Sphingobacterium psychroaquaticum]QBQ41889.1 SusC/RagA family TonB-linked outer membrane protein [Sphingobacterium psychroaquaticum]
MKYYFTALCLVFVSLSSYAFSQNFTLKLQNVRFERLVQEIEKNSNYRFVYDPKEINSKATFSISVTNGGINSVLSQAFSKNQISYQVIGETIVVKNTPTTLGSVQQHIHGQVFNQDQEPLPNVSIRNKANNSNYLTDTEGKFSVNTKGNTTLVFSSIGYKTKEIQVTNVSELTVHLEADLGNLDEVVVIGYGTSSLRKNVGSVSSVTAKDIDKQPVMDPLAALQGRIAGLSISSNSGLPGGSFNVQLRGANSISNGNSPLYVIDGVPFSDNSMNQFNMANGTQSPLSIINPRDIERIDIMKDADATAIYGSRAANGVILITTKKGSSQGLVVDAGVNIGNSSAINKLKMLNTAQFLEIRREAFNNDGVTPNETNAPDLLVWDQQTDMNWQNALYGHKAAFNNMQLSFRGGSESIQYLFSGNYNQQGDVLPGDKNYKKGGALLNVSSQSASRRFKFTASANFNADKNNTVPADIAQYYNLPTNYNPYNPDGSYYWFGTSLQNPFASMDRTSISRTKSLLANTALSYQVWDGLEAKLNMGYNYNRMNQLQMLPEKGFNPLTSSGATANYAYSDYNSYIIEPQLNYSKQIKEHDFKVLLGGTWQQSISEGENLYGVGYPSDSQLENIRAASKVTVNNYNYADYRYQSFFGRISYGFKDRYLFNVSGRRDGSTRFGPKNRYGNFGSIGAAWVFTEEEFFKNQHILSFGKLRGSIGVTGNDQIGNYRFLDTWSAGFPYQNIAGLSPSRVFNPFYSWEENKKREIALDLGFLNDRFFLTTNYYNNRSDNQLIDIMLAPQTGFSSYLGNQPALVENSGWEFELNSTNIKKKDFVWSSSVNLTLPKNKLLKYPNLENSSSKNSYVIGESVRVVRGFQFTGVDPETGLAQFLDVNGDGKITEYTDFVTLGNLMPSFFGGISNSFSYKQIALSFLFQFVKQEGPSIAYGPQASHIGALSNMDVAVLDRWQKPGDITDVPRATATASNPAYTTYRDRYRYSSAAWDDASFIRLKNVAVSYDLSNWSQKINIRKMMVNFSAQNLFTWTSFRGLDPEMQGFDRAYVSQVNPFGAVRTSSTPSIRTYTFGLQVSF